MQAHSINDPRARHSFGRVTARITFAALISGGIVCCACLLFMPLNSNAGRLGSEFRATGAPAQFDSWRVSNEASSHAIVTFGDGSQQSDFIAGMDSAVSRALSPIDEDRYNWILVNANAGFPARYAHAAVMTLDQSIFVMGGATADMQQSGTGGPSSGYQNDVWVSRDQGATWEFVIPRSERFRPRRGHAAVSNANRVVIFLLGGFCGMDCFMNDWWSSETGAVWHSMGQAPWSARHGHAAVISSDEKLILLGGHDGASYLNDVWSIVDPAQALVYSTWTRVNEQSSWSPRYGHGVVIDSLDSIILMGGFYADKKSGHITCFNDVWRSEDAGTTWALLVRHSPWSGRYQHAAVITNDDNIFVIGGLGANLDRFGDAWRSKDSGQVWDLVTPAAPWAARYEHAVVADRNRTLYILGGMSTGADKYHDVWRSEQTCADVTHCTGETLCRDGSNEHFIGIPRPLCVGLCDRRIFNDCTDKEACRVQGRGAECYDPCHEQVCHRGEVCQVLSRHEIGPDGLPLEAAMAQCLACSDSMTKFACDPLRQCTWDAHSEECKMKCNVLKDKDSCAELTYCEWKGKMCKDK